jgi:hypothetical protein
MDMNDREQVTARLEELKTQNLPHMTADIFAKNDEFFKAQLATCSEEEKTSINEELKPFLGQELDCCIISGDRPCLGWGLVHGIMIDSKTGLSWGAYHYFTMNGERRKFVRYLQYHPDCYSVCDED